MKIVIVGAGVVGSSLAEHLSRQGHQIAIIDAQAEVCEPLEQELDILAVTGHGSSPRVLEQAGIRQADMLIAVTPDDDTNLVACHFARQFGVAKRIARIQNPDYTADAVLAGLAEIGATDVVEPEREVVGNILQYIEIPGVTESANFMHGSICLRGYRVRDNMPVAGKTLAEIGRLPGADTILIVLIIRKGHSILPSGQDVVQAGDEIIAILPAESLADFRTLIACPERRHRKIIIAGGTLTSILLADAVRPFAEQVVLVDPDEAHSRAAASRLEGVEVLQGDCTRNETLQETGIGSASVFIGAGRETEENLMACVMAKAEGAGAAIAICYGERHVELFGRLGLDRIVSPRQITAQAIMATVLKIPIGAMLRFRDADVEVTRLVAEKNSPILRKPLARFADILRRTVIVGSVLRDDRVIVPAGSTRIREDDVVLVLYRPGAARQVERLFHTSRIRAALAAAGRGGARRRGGAPEEPAP